MTPLASSLPAMDPNAAAVPAGQPRSALQALVRDLQRGSRRLLRNPLTVAGAAVIVLIVLIFLLVSSC